MSAEPPGHRCRLCCARATSTGRPPWTTVHRQDFRRSFSAEGSKRSHPRPLAMKLMSNNRSKAGSDGFSRILDLERTRQYARHGQQRAEKKEMRTITAIKKFNNIIRTCQKKCGYPVVLKHFTTHSDQRKGSNLNNRSRIVGYSKKSSDANAALIVINTPIRCESIEVESKG